MPLDAPDEIVDNIEALEAQAAALVAGLRELKAQVTEHEHPGLPAAERRPGLPGVEEPQRGELPRPPRPHVEGELVDDEHLSREPIIAPAAPVRPELETRTGTTRQEPARPKYPLLLLVLGAAFLLLALALPSAKASFACAVLAALVALTALALVIAGWARKRLGK